MIGLILVAAALLLNPLGLLFFAYYVAAPLAEHLVPACRTREYATGEHLGYRIGMSRAEAVATLEDRYAGQPFPGVFITDEHPRPPHTPEDYLRPSPGSSDARTLAEVEANTGPDQKWSLVGHNTCVVSQRETQVHFRAGHIVKLVDAVSTNWL